MSSSPKSPFVSVVPFVVCVVLLNLLFVVYVVFSLGTLSKYKREYKIDNSDFVSAVATSVSNFLFSISVSASASASAPSSLFPSVRRVDNLGFASSPRYGNYFVLDGASYREGDYSEFGLVISVSSDRAYCNSSNGVAILSWKTVYSLQRFSMFQNPR